MGRDDAGQEGQLREGVDVGELVGADVDLLELGQVLDAPEGKKVVSREVDLLEVGEAGQHGAQLGNFGRLELEVEDVDGPQPEETLLLGADVLVSVVDPLLQVPQDELIVVEVQGRMVLLEALLDVFHVLRLQNLVLIGADQVLYVRKLSHLKVLLIRKFIEYLELGVVAPDGKEDVFFEVLQEEIASLLLAGGDGKEVVKLPPRYGGEDDLIVHGVESLFEELDLGDLLPFLYDEPKLQKLAEQFLLVPDIGERIGGEPHLYFLHKLLYFLVEDVKPEEGLDGRVTLLGHFLHHPLYALVAKLLKGASPRVEFYVVNHPQVFAVCTNEGLLDVLLYVAVGYCVFSYVRAPPPSQFEAGFPLALGAGRRDPPDGLGGLVLAEDEEVDDGVVLGYDVAEGGKDPEVRPDELVDEVVELAVELLLEILLLEYAQLQLAEHSVFEEQVYENIVALVVEPVFNFYYLQEIGVGFLNFVEDCEDVAELVLVADVPGPEQIPYLQADEVYLTQGLPLPFPDNIVVVVDFVVLTDPLPCL